MKDFHEAITQMEPIGSQAGGSIELQLVTGRPRKLRDDTQMGMVNTIEVRKLLQKLVFFAEGTCFMEDLEDTVPANAAVPNNDRYEKVTERQAMNVLAAICRVVAERFIKTREAMEQANGAPSDFIDGYVKMAEEKGHLKGRLSEESTVAAKLNAENVQLAGANTQLTINNSVLTGKLSEAEETVLEHEEKIEILQTTIGKQRLLIGALIGALAVGGLGMGAGAFACYKAGIFEKVTSHETAE